jgi:hypothetical protein
MVSILLGLFPNLPAAAQPITLNHENEYVVLLHGLGRTTSSMRKLEKLLLSRGYETINFGYPSRREPIERIAGVHIPAALAQCRRVSASKIHFVTHSLGGIILRQYLQANSLPEGSRIVMLAPPNRGSEAVDYLKKFFFFRWLTGPAGQQMGTDPESLPNSLKPIGADIGIISGNRSLNPFFSALIPGPDDGRVSVERAKLEEMADFLVVPSSHTFIMKNPTVIKQVLHFLEHGTFDHTHKLAGVRP